MWRKILKSFWILGESVPKNFANFFQISRHIESLDIRIGVLNIDENKN